MGSRIHLVIFIFCCLSPCWLWAQQAKPDWRKAPVHSYEPDIIQIRLSAAAFDRLPGHELTKSGTEFKAIPAIDSIWKQFGLLSFKKLVNIEMRPSKTGLGPAENNVLRWIRIKLPNAKTLPLALEAFEHCKPWVEMAEPVYKVELHGNEEQPLFDFQWFPNDSLFARQWHYHNTGQTGGTPDADIDLPEAWDIERGHPSVLVGVLDNGIDTQHVDLRPNLSALRGYNFYEGQPGLVPGNHGNHTSGTIAARTNNVSWVSGIAGGDGSAESGVRLVSCQIFGVPSGSGGIENAFVWSAQNGVAISSNSWGYVQADVYNQSVLDAIDFFIENGGGSVLKNGLVVFSGGNSGTYEQRYPGVYEKVIGVTGSNHNDIRSWYATIHEKIDITAPGGETNTSSGGPIVNDGRGGVLSTIVQAAGAVGYLQGTSMAAPHVAGVAALIASHGRERLSADDVKSILLTQTDPIENLQPTFAKGRMGTGRLNAFKALNLTRQLVLLPDMKAPVSLVATPACGDIDLSWVKGNESDAVMVAVSTESNRGGLFGIPVGNYTAGDSLPGGARIIYKGTASSFKFTGSVEGQIYYFKIWTAGTASAYSMGIVSRNGVTIGSNIQSFDTKVNCYQYNDLNWVYEAGCTGKQVLIAFNTQNSFGVPSGNYAPGDMLGSAKVIYVGGGNSFRHQLPALPDSAFLYYQLFTLNTDGTYGQAIAANASTPGAITKAYPKSSNSNSVLCAWERHACFSGEVLVAWNRTGNFNEPQGVLNPGDIFPGGGDTVLYRGALSEVLHSGLLSNTQYYYGVWSIINNQYGQPRFFAAKTRCNSLQVNLPFRDTISPTSLSGCTLDTLGVWNFTAGPLPKLTVVETGINPSASAFGGRYMLAFNSYDTRESNEVLLTTPALNTTGHQLVDVAFKWYEDNTEYNSEFFAKEGITVLWSSDYVNWDTVIAYPRITRYGQNGWKYKQVTLPPAAANQPAVYVRWAFRSAWGYNCYLDEIAVIPTNPKKANGIFTPAVAQFTDSTTGATHFYNAGEELLISVKSGVEFLGHVNDSLTIEVGGNLAAQKINASGNYVANPGGWGVTGKYWHVDKWIEPLLPVSVKQYYHTSELQSLETLSGTAFVPVVPADNLPLMAYQLNKAGRVITDPQTNHAGIKAGISFGNDGFWQYDRLTAIDSLHFTMAPFLPGWQVVEHRLPKTGGGGLGKGSVGGNGALLPHWMSINGTRFNTTTALTWATGYERLWILMVVERAFENDTAYKVIGYSSPGGWSQQGGQYSLTDAELLPNGNYRYHIKAFDKNGKMYISPDVLVKVDDTKGVNVFPNPVTGGRLTVFSENTMEQIRMIDAAGRVVLTAKPNSTQYFMQLPSLPKGVYFIQVFMNNKVVTSKVIVSQ